MMLKSILCLFVLINAFASETIIIVDMISGLDEQGCGSLGINRPCFSLGYAISHNKLDVLSVHYIINAGIYTGEENTNLTFGGPNSITGSHHPDITISGNGEVSFDFDGKHPGWHIYSYPGNFNISHITFQNMYGTGLSFTGNMPREALVGYSVDNCHFIHGIILPAIDPHHFNGAAIHVDVDAGPLFVKISNSVIKEFLGDLTQETYGPVAILSGNVTIDFCTFQSNIANYGVIAISSSVDRVILDIIVDHCQFKTNVGNHSAAIHSFLQDGSKYDPGEYRNNVITGNRATKSIVAFTQGKQLVSKNQINDNIAEHALFIEATDEEHSTTLINITINNNNNPHKESSGTGVGLKCQGAHTKVFLQGYYNITNNHFGNTSLPSVDIDCVGLVKPTGQPTSQIPTFQPFPTDAPTNAPSNNVALKVILPIFFIGGAIAIAAFVYWRYWIKPQNSYEVISENTRFT